MLAFMAAPIIGFAFVVYPVEASAGLYSLHFWPFAASLELFLAALMGGQSYERLWRARQMWAGLSPVYAKACILALRGGPHRKPEYVVTRKHDEFAWYWRETLPHTVFLVLLLGTLAYSLATTSLASSFDVGSAYWALFFGILIGGFVRKSWFGVDLRARLARLVSFPRPRTPLAAPGANRSSGLALAAADRGVPRRSGLRRRGAARHQSSRARRRARGTGVDPDGCRRGGGAAQRAPDGRHLADVRRGQPVRRGGCPGSVRAG